MVVVEGAPGTVPRRLGARQRTAALAALVEERFSSDWWVTVETCPVCGVQGACAYDAEGRALIHTDTELPEDEASA